ncbi:MAG: glycerophosphodiester phosphodiesterase family protein, partial [Henriciella sp.]
ISFNGRPYAHRGLWSPESVPENSSGAFARAASKGLGIELDVRLSRDFVPMVFHDRNLERMTGIAADVSDYNAVELQ